MVTTPSAPASFPVTAPAGSWCLHSWEGVRGVGVDGGRERTAIVPRVTGLGPPSSFTKLPQGPPAWEGPVEPGRNPGIPKVTSQPAQPWTRDQRMAGPLLDQCPLAVQPLARCFRSLKLRRPLSTWLRLLQQQPFPRGTPAEATKLFFFFGP